MNDSPVSTGPHRKPNWWQRRISGPVRQQLTQGITPDRIALTLALGFTLGVFPILGSGFLLCGVAGWMFKLNQPLIQATGTLAYPLQLILLLPFYRAGEWVFRIPPVPLAIPDLIARFFAHPGVFLREYGMTGLRGILVWTVLAPPVLAGLYAGLRPLLAKGAARLAGPRKDPPAGTGEKPWD